MLGAVIGDIVGSRFEFMATQERDVELLHSACSFTDDTVCTSAISAGTAIAQNILLIDHPDNSLLSFSINEKQTPVILNIYKKTLKQIAMQYPMAGYGKMFMHWLTTGNQEPYQSLGNGILMRLSPIVLQTHSLEEALYFAELSGAISHNHPDAIQSAKQYMELLWICKIWQGDSLSLKVALKEKIAQMHITVHSVEEYHKLGGFYVLAPDTLVRSLACVLEAENFEETMQNALYIGSDTDTTAAIAGALAEILYGIPLPMLKKTISYFNFSSLALLQQVIQSYSQNNIETIGKLMTENCFKETYKIWYSDTLLLVLEDPTAAWDPLDINDEDYYTEIDKVLIRERESMIQTFLRKVGLKK